MAWRGREGGEISSALGVELSVPPLELLREEINLRLHLLLHLRHASTGERGGDGDEREAVRAVAVRVAVRVVAQGR